ncbi:hypothetical protein [Herpetosiphon sp. NSE202]|uniref:hypothetical protein n=1 Tax=Herpetosiphon sp. NSE202 TaxID=3351349 RepID=UPI003636F21E
MSKRQSKRPSGEALTKILEHNAQIAPQQTSDLVWGIKAELQSNRRGELHPDQIKRILKISIFDIWIRLAFGGFFLVFALTQRTNSWQFWVPLAIALFPLISAINGALARQRLKKAKVETIEGSVNQVKVHRSEAVSATLHRDSLYMFLLNDQHSKTLPKPEQAYRFYVAFGVIRPGIVVAIEALDQVPASIEA